MANLGIMKDRVMRQTNKAVTLIVRMWQGSDGAVKASVKPADGGETLHFPDLSSLMKYLEAKQEGFAENSSETQGLR